MWFIYVLFFIKILDLFLEKNRKKLNLSRKPLIALLAIFVIIIQVFPNLYLPRPLNWIIISFPFYFCGRLLKSYDWILVKTGKAVKLIIGIVLLTVPYIGMKYNGFVDLYSWILGNSIFAYYIVGILSSIGLFFLFSSNIYVENKVIRTLSDGTILIVAFHKLILYFLLEYNTYLLARISISALVVLLFYSPIYLSSKYFPLLIGKNK